MSRGFVRSAAALAGGTGAAQLILILVLPLLTRMYSPEDFGVLAAYSAILAIMSIGACLGYDNAIPIPRSDTDAINLLAFAIAIALSLGLALSFLVMLVPEAIGTILHQPVLVPYLWLLPVGITLAGTYSALRFWFSRQKKFKVIAVNRITQVMTGSSAQLILGRLSLGPFGLLLGQLLNSGAGSIGLLVRLRAYGVRKIYDSVSLSTILRIAREHRAFAVYTTPGLMANTAAVQVPLLLVAATAEAAAGFLLIAMRVMQAPLSLVGAAVSNVYYAHASEAHRGGHLTEMSAAVMLNLSRFGIGPLLFVALVAPEMFAVLFGESWRPAGALVAWMTPWLSIQLLVSPVSTALWATGRQRDGMFLQIFGLVVRVLPVLIALYYLPSHVAEVFCVSGAVFYSVYLVVIASAVRLSVRRVICILLACVPGVTLAIAFAFVAQKLVFV